jgi:hypothetical protein
VDIRCDGVGLQRVGFHVLRPALKHGLLHVPIKPLPGGKDASEDWTERIVLCRLSMTDVWRPSVEGEEQTGGRLPTWCFVCTNPSTVIALFPCTLQLVTQGIVLECFVGVFLNGPLVDSSGALPSRLPTSPANRGKWSAFCDRTDTAEKEWSGALASRHIALHIAHRQ